MTTARTSHALIVLQDGRALVSGGRDFSTTITTAEVYEP